MINSKSILIIDTIKLLQSEKWYGCSDVIEIAKGKNAYSRTWPQAKEKMKRAWLMERSKLSNKKEGITKKIFTWLSRKN